jgi:hypothetical protein
MNAKPIFLVRFPQPYVVALGNERFTQMNVDLQQRLSDYHVLFVIDSSISEVKMECFNAENLAATDVESIRQQVFDSMDAITKLCNLEKDLTQMFDSDTRVGLAILEEVRKLNKPKNNEQSRD